MRFSLSPRLLACSSFVTPGSRVADIGCDHGYLSIHLLLSGTADWVIAADVNRQPLESAMRNAEKYGVRDKMAFYLSDGVSSIPRDFDTLVCAGMGADTIVSILEAAPWLQSSNFRLILQCQSKTPMLRRYLSDRGWHIQKETVVRDGRFLYTVMAVCHQPDAPRLTVGQCHFSPALAAYPTPETKEYYHSVLQRLRRAISGRGSEAVPELAQALSELEGLKEDYT